MSLKVVHLRKLLALFYSSNNRRVSLLRQDIRLEFQRDRGEKDEEGGDFHIPFWADVKDHVADLIDLREASVSRISKNRQRARLYPQLTDGFLSWWNERRRWRNEPFKLLPQSVKARAPVAPDRTVKVENVLAFRIGNQDNRLVYPYFSEEPILTDEGARLGLWLLGEALGEFKIDDMRILDVLRSKSFGTIDGPLRGNERDLFLEKYDQLLEERKRLRTEYE